MFHLKDTKEVKEAIKKWKELKQKKYLESMGIKATTGTKI